MFLKSQSTMNYFVVSPKLFILLTIANQAFTTYVNIDNTAAEEVGKMITKILSEAQISITIGADEKANTEVQAQAISQQSIIQDNAVFKVGEIEALDNKMKKLQIKVSHLFTRKNKIGECLNENKENIIKIAKESSGLAVACLSKSFTYRFWEGRTLYIILVGCDSTKPGDFVRNFWLSLSIKEDAEKLSEKSVKENPVFSGPAATKLYEILRDFSGLRNAEIQEMSRDERSEIHSVVVRETKELLKEFSVLLGFSIPLDEGEVTVEFRRTEMELPSLDNYVGQIIPDAEFVGKYGKTVEEFVAQKMVATIESNKRDIERSLKSRKTIGFAIEAVARLHKQSVFCVVVLNGTGYSFN